MEADEGDTERVLFPPLPNPPSNFVEGVFRGAGAAITGVCQGALVAVCTPIVGGVQHGAVGAAQGVVVGSVNGALLCLNGVVGCARYIVTGFSNTPKYCSTLVTPIPYNLTQEQYEVSELMKLRDEQIKKEKEEALDKEKDFTKTKSVKDSEYYDTLGVYPNSTQSQISKAFRRKAIQLHPDRFRSKSQQERDEAEKEFKACVEAHNVLSKDDLRTKYDLMGKTEGDSNLNMELTTFLAIVFGNDQFHEFMGEPQLEIFGTDLKKLLEATPEDLELETGLSENRTGEEASEILKNTRSKLARDKLSQRKREVDLAMKLAELLDECEKSGWERKIAELSERLAKASYGKYLLHTIGVEYIHHAGIWDGIFITRSLKRPIGKLVRGTRQFQQYVKFMDACRMIATEVINANENAEEPATKSKGMLDIQSALNKAAKRNKKGNDTTLQDDEEARREEALSRALFKLGWSLVALDITRTVSGVCNRVLSDTSVSRNRRVSRIKALAVLGKAFCLEGKPPKDVNIDMDAISKAVTLARIRARNKELGVTDEENPFEDPDPAAGILGPKPEMMEGDV
uniref:J domain-containing protein n=1 Tax=Amorphochlora amoebiformis TaxID=1561963 RepID=A0A7S0D8E6_9EUKA